MGCIYQILNRTNGKRYVGQTKNHLKRWTSHRTVAYNPNSDYYNNPLYRAIRKYGLENFEFSVIEWVDVPTILSERESYYIEALKTMSPYGYNLMQLKKNGVVVFRPETIRTKSRLSHSRKRGTTSPFKGVFVSSGKIYCQIEYRQKVYCKGGFKTQECAAQTYDKMALFLFGKNACRNFEDENYTSKQLEIHFRWFVSASKSSRYHGVSRVRESGHWRCVVVLDGKIEGFGSYTNERQAAEAHDIICLHLQKPGAKLNFPDLALEFLKIDPAPILFRKNLKQNGFVIYRKNRFEGRFKYHGHSFYCGVFMSEELARQAINVKKAEILADLT